MNNINKENVINTIPLLSLYCEKQNTPIKQICRFNVLCNWPPSGAPFQLRAPGYCLSCLSCRCTSASAEEPDMLEYSFGIFV